MAVKWSRSILEKFIAPEICSFTQAEIPDLSSIFTQSQYWIGNHFLNNVFRVSYPSKFRQVVLHFLRRANNAFNSYHSARSLTLNYLKDVQPYSPAITRYYAAVSEWESFTISCSIAIDLFVWLNGGEKPFKKNDGTKEQRLYTVANQVKHTAKCIKSTQLTENDVIPLWLSNDGLQSFKLKVLYSEAAEVLTDIAKLAEELQDPNNFIKNHF